MDRRQLLLREAGGCEAALLKFIRIAVDRKYLLEHTWASLFDRPVAELLAPKVTVQFKNESGIDAGGLTRDWFDSVGRAVAEQGSDSLLAMAPDQTLIPQRVGDDR